MGQTDAATSAAYAHRALPIVISAPVRKSLVKRHAPRAKSVVWTRAENLPVGIAPIMKAVKGGSASASPHAKTVKSVASIHAVVPPAERALVLPQTASIKPANPTHVSPTVRGKTVGEMDAEASVVRAPDQTSAPNLENASVSPHVTVTNAEKMVVAEAAAPALGTTSAKTANAYVFPIAATQKAPVVMMAAAEVAALALSETAAPMACANAHRVVPPKSVATSMLQLRSCSLARENAGAAKAPFAL